MSYEPTILIRRSDLEKNKTKISLHIFRNDKLIKPKVFEIETLSVYKYLSQIFDWPEYRFVKFEEIELVVIHPELTSFNARVRKVLHDLDIDFAVTN